MITSRANPRIKQLRALRQRKERDSTQLFVVEGIAHVAAAIEAGAHVEYVCYAPELLTSPFAREMVERESARGLPCYPTALDVFESAGEKEHPAGVLAVVRQERVELDCLAPNNFDFGVALVSPQDPGNIGSILRTIDAVGASGLILLDGGADVYHPTAVRASMGALFSKKVASATFSQFAHWAERHAFHVVGTSARASGDYRAAAYARPLLLLMGSEQKGLTEEHMTRCDELVRIPMAGKTSSLNLSVAAGVILYQAVTRVADTSPLPGRPVEKN